MFFHFESKAMKPKEFALRSRLRVKPKEAATERELRPRSDHPAIDLGASLRVEGLTFQPPHHPAGPAPGRVTPPAAVVGP